jgi:hypothetical protein
MAVVRCRWFRDGRSSIFGGRWGQDFVVWTEKDDSCFSGSVRGHCVTGEGEKVRGDEAGASNVHRAGVWCAPRDLGRHGRDQWQVRQMDGLGWEGLGRDDAGVRVTSVMQDNYLGSKFMRWCRLAGKMVRRLEVGEEPSGNRFSDVVPVLGSAVTTTLGYPGPCRVLWLPAVVLPCEYLFWPPGWAARAGGTWYRGIWVLTRAGGTPPQFTSERPRA